MILCIQRHVSPILERDNSAFLDGMAFSASQAMDQHDSRQAYAIVRCLAGKSFKPTPCVFLKNSSGTSDPPQVRHRWLEHFSEVLGGVPTDDATLRESPRPHLDVATSLDVGPVATSADYAALGRNKGVDYDRIPAELLQAGGPSSVQFFCGELVSASKCVVASPVARRAHARSLSEKGWPSRLRL